MKNQTSGFTLIELMVAVSIIAIAMSFAIPGMRSLVVSNQLSAIANDYRSALSFARMEAIRRGESVSVVSRSGTNWGGGLQIALSSNLVQEQLPADASILKVIEPAPGSLALKSENALISFNARGFISTPSTIDVCGEDAAGQFTGRTLTIEVSGKASISETQCSDG